ncbi:PTS sugar transporter subunit IIB [Fusibacter ferrireducens]|nr:hypothetical protein [Fusibacter ferrireducens]
MFVCAGGMSTTITAKKLEEISKENGVAMTVNAFGASGYLRQLETEQYDVLLVAPQIRHRFDAIKEECAKFEDLIVDKIPPNMYAPMDPIVKKLFDYIMAKINA